MIQNKKLEDLKSYISNTEIKNKVCQIANQINSDYKNICTYENPLYVICILKGAVLFFSELVQKLNIPINMCFVTISSYGNSTISSGNVSYLNLNLPDLNEKNLLIVEDIVDTGLTLESFKKHLEDKFNPKTIKIAALLNKKASLHQVQEYKIYL